MKQQRARKRVRHVNYATSVVTSMVPAVLQTNVGQALALNSVLFVVAKLLRQHILTHTGLLHAFGLGVLLWTCLSWQGYSLCFSFLIIGSLATKIGKEEKERLGIAEKRGGARGPENLWGAAGVAALCALSAFASTYFTSEGPGVVAQVVHETLLVGYTASLATKLSDTMASEIGKAYGKTTYLVTSFELVPQGTEGAVSLEGTAAGTIASFAAALYSLCIGLIGSWMDVGIVVLAAFVATTAESFIGATVQERLQWSNEFVNFVNTAIGAIVGMGLKLILLSV